MHQNTNEWTEWRKQGIGASEVPIVIGISPWSTPYQLWQEKTGRKKSFEGNHVTHRGQELESKARKLYELTALEDMAPQVAIHPKYPICRCSLDGIRADGNLILEIKCPGEETHALAKAGKLPPYYMAQVQYQLAVTGADSCHYFSFGKDESFALIEVLPDLKQQGELIAAALHFWDDYILKDIPPPLMPQDVKEVNSPQFESLFALAARGSVEAKFNIINIGGHNKIRFGKYLCTKIKSKSGKDTYRLTTRTDGT